MSLVEAEIPKEGPFVQENWRRALAGQPSRCAFEYPLYSDAHITAEASFGPYKLLNAVPLVVEQLGSARAAVHLQVEDHSPDEYRVPNMNQTDSVRYHGGLLEDEVASLVALTLGVRFWAGASTREFWPNRDPRGTPRFPMFDRVPMLKVREPRPIVPRAFQTVSLADAERFLSLVPDLPPEGANALIRAARSYQQALWVAESEPELAWIFFVSAVETAADWWFVGQLDNLVLLQSNKPALYDRLMTAGEEYARAVADEFAQGMRATYKFLNFLRTYFPEPPDKRPAEQWQQGWTWDALRRPLEFVYRYRSDALHEARPFPPPMCQPPFDHRDWEAPSEVPMPGALATRGGVWRAKDTPMILNTFEYIVRHSLLRWWTDGAAGAEA